MSIYKKVTILLSFVCVFASHYAIAITTDVDHHFTLKNINSNVAFAGKINGYVYLLNNNNNHPTTIKIKETSNVIHINHRLSNCNGHLEPHGTCKLYLTYLAPNKSGIHKTYLDIMNADETIKLPMTFKVVDRKPQARLAISSQLTWHSINAPPGGEVSDIFISPSDPKTIYVAVWGVGVYKSRDGGHSFHQLNIASPDFPFLPKQFAYSRGTLYLLTVDKIYATTDGGATWYSAYSEKTSVNAMVSYDNTLYVADDFGVSRFVPATVQQPAHLELTGKFPIDFPVVTHILPIGNGIIYAAAPTGIYKSTDNGKTWRLIKTDIPESGYITTMMNVNGTIYVGANNNEGKGMIYKSSDGEHFVRSDKGIGDLGIIALAHKNNTLYAGTGASVNNKISHGGGIFVSTDGGQSWYPRNTGLYYKIVTSIKAVGSNLYIGTIGGLYQSADQGDSWQAMDKGIDGQKLTDVLLTSDDTIIAGTVEGSLYFSQDFGVSWAIGKGVDTANTIPILSNSLGQTKSGVIYAATDNSPSALYISNDEGQTWTKSFQTNERILITTSHNSNIYLGTAGDNDLMTIYVSRDSGNSWQELTTESLSTSWFSMAIINDVLYLSAFDKDMMPSIYETKLSDSSTWHSARGNLPNQLNSINQLIGVEDGTENGVLYALGSAPTTLYNGIYRTHNGGKTWEPISAQLNDSTLTCLIVKGDTIITGALTGIFISTDGGLHWQQANDGLVPQTPYPNPIYKLSNNGHVIIASDHRNLYQSSFS